MPEFINVEVAKNFEHALECLKAKEDLGDVFVIGGTSVFEVLLRFTLDLSNIEKYNIKY